MSICAGRRERIGRISRRHRSWAISAARRCGASVRLHETDTVSAPGLPTTFGFPTDADTNKGPILNSGCGCDAINTWARALPGRALSSRSARNGPAMSRRLIPLHGPTHQDDGLLPDSLI